MMTTKVDGVEIKGPMNEQYASILTPEALTFLVGLHRSFNTRRLGLLVARRERQADLERGARPDFLAETLSVRSGDWKVAAVPHDLQDRRVEITGPVDRKMVINALNSGARVFMADFEDANAPSWTNCMDGQVNLRDACRRAITFTNSKGKAYRLKDDIATLVVRPRGWHLPEKHLFIDGKPASASLVDFGLYFFHNAKELVDRAKGADGASGDGAQGPAAGRTPGPSAGPYFYLPKLEGHLEARLWNDVFNHAQDELGIPRGTIKATVLIETILAAFEMEEILYELRDHSAGLNAGRWDYIFSVIKKFRDDPRFMLPDRGEITMTVPFMQAYSDLLVKTCHKRGAFAMGGMAAFIPSKDEEANARAFRKVREDKVREATAGFDGTWVAHPGLVPVALEVFDKVLGDRPNQLDRQRDDVNVTAKNLLDVTIAGGAITEAGVRQNVNVGILYIESWLRGVGAAALHNLMEDAATAEISRSQIWQWVRHDAALKDGGTVTPELVKGIVAEEMAAIRETLGPDRYRKGRFEEAREVFEAVALDDEFRDFLTLPAYDILE